MTGWPVFDDEQVAAAAAVLRSGKVNYWTGEEGRAFEAEFAAAVGCRYGIALANGTVALELALRSLDIGPLEPRSQQRGRSVGGQHEHREPLGDRGGLVAGQPDQVRAGGHHDPVEAGILRGSRSATLSTGEVIGGERLRWAGRHRASSGKPSTRRTVRHTGWSGRDTHQPHFVGDPPSSRPVRRSQTRGGSKSYAAASRSPSGEKDTALAPSGSDDDSVPFRQSSPEI